MKRKEKKNFYVIALAVLITISMIGSIFAIVLDNYQSNNIKYGKYSFVVTNTGTYKVKVNGQFMEFTYFPSDLERIPLDSRVKEKLSNSAAFAIIFDPVESNQSLEFVDYVRYEIQNQVQKQVFFGITQESERYLLPVLGCDNATAAVPLILIVNSDNTSIAIDKDNENCILMNARLRDIIAAKDRIVYSMNNIMQ